jgi:hypothetical protein
MGDNRVVYKVLVGKRKAKRPLGRPRCRWEDNIKMDLQKVGCGGIGGSSWLRIEKLAGYPRLQIRTQNM